MLTLTLVSGPDRGRTFRLPEDVPHLIGRETGSVALHDTKISRRHAEIIARDGQVMIRDLGSSNGTYVDKRKIADPAVLHEGSVVQVGQTLCVVSRVPEPSTAGLSELAEVKEALIRVEQTLMAGRAPDHSQTLHEMQRLLAESADREAQLQSQIQQLLELQASPPAVVELSAKVDALSESLNRPDEHLQAPDGPQTSEPPWLEEVERLMRETAAGSGTQVAQCIDALGEAMGRIAALQGLEPKIQALLENGQPVENSAEAPAEAALAATVAALEAKLDVVLETVHNVPIRSQAQIVALEEKMAGLLEVTRHEPDESPDQEPDPLQGIERKLDDLLAIVAASHLPESESEAGGPTLETLKQAADQTAEQVTAILDAVHAMSAAGDAGQEDIGRGVAGAPAVDGLFEAVRRQGESLDERIMHHLRGSAEAAEMQMRGALSELTEAVRALADGSDRVLLEQVLTELRDSGLHEMRKLLGDVTERVRRLPSASTAETGEVQRLRHVINAVASQVAALMERPAAPDAQMMGSAVQEAVREPLELLRQCMEELVKTPARFEASQLEGALSRALAEQPPPVTLPILEDLAAQLRTVAEVQQHHARTTEQLLGDVARRLEQLPVNPPTVDPHTIHSAVRAALADQVPAVEPAVLEGIEEQMRALGSRLDPQAALEDLFTLLRSVEQSQQQQVQWVQRIVEWLEGAMVTGSQDPSSDTQMMTALPEAPQPGEDESSGASFEGDEALLAEALQEIITSEQSQERK